MNLKQEAKGEGPLELLFFKTEHLFMRYLCQVYIL